MRRIRHSGSAVVVGFALAVNGCIDPNSQLIATAPVEDPVVETAPLADVEVEEEVVVEDVVFDSVDECLVGNWDVNNDSFGQFFAQTDERVAAINVDGLATMTVDDGTYRMFFEEWAIRYDTGDPTFLVLRNGSETVQFSLTPDNALEVVNRDDQIIFELFSLLGGGDGDAVAIATTDPGSLPLEGATLRCTAETLEVVVDEASFFFDRR